MTLSTGLRSFAVAIALLAVLDPALTSTRRVDATVAVVAADSAAHGELAERVANELERRFTVTRGAFPGADATVLVGDRLPARLRGIARPVFAVIPEEVSPSVTLERVRVPARVGLHTQVAVHVDVGIRGASDEVLHVALQWEGMEVDRREVRVRPDEDRVRVALAAVPGRAGPLVLTVEAGLPGAPARAVRDVVVDVEEARWQVLFFDSRPSWMSTFVRRALEQDPRFVVTSRTLVSQGLATDFGAPPAGLADPAPLAPFDVIVVGAPEELRAGDVAGLEHFLRRRGGSVLVLLDRLAPGSHDALLRVPGWVLAEEGPPRDVLPEVGGSPPILRGHSFAWPTALPPGARALAHVAGAGGDGEGSRTVVWSVPVGAGRLTVSGALDSWQFRDPEVAGFDPFWRGIVAEGAAASLPPIELRLEEAGGVVRPGTRHQVTAVLRDVALADAGPEGIQSPQVGAASLRTSSLRTERGVGGEERLVSEPRAVRLWPEASVGRFRGSFRAPSAPGTYRIVVQTDDLRAALPLVVDPETVHPPGEDPAVLASWIGANGGEVHGAEARSGLARELEAAVGGERRRERWHPMRSGWWILPFAFALGGEWWWRRRRGLR